MMRKAGERLFEAIGQLPEEMILEAENDGLSEDAGNGAVHRLDEKNGIRADTVEFDESGSDMTGQQTSEQSMLHRETENTGKMQELGDKNTGSGMLRQQQENAENVQDTAGTEPENGMSGQKFHNAQNKSHRAGIDSENGVLGEKCRSTGSMSPQRGTQSIDPSDCKHKKQGWSSRISRIGGYLKYLPVAACLCIVCSGVFYIVGNYMNADKSAPFSMSGQNSSGGIGQDDKAAMNGQAIAEDTAESGNFDDSSESAGGSETADDSKIEGDSETSQYTSGSGMADQPGWLPLRNDAYEGPVFSMTATGDTHNLTTKRRLKAVVETEAYKDLVQPQLYLKDTYEIGNHSKEDKTLQLVYPFVSTLNLAYDLEGEVIQIEGQDATSVSYNIGDSIWAYLDQPHAGQSSVEDYEEFLKKAQDYQEHALEKEVDWSREVSVYTFTDIRVEDTDAGSYSGVAGVRVKGTGVDVLTYGFDHSFEAGEGVSNYCFFIPEEAGQIMMIVTGEPEEEPELGFYTNLDCDQTTDGITCDMKKEKMSYANALRLCSKAASRQVQQDYETGIYEGELPEYFNDDAVFKALTAAGDEDTFYAHITERYHTAELREIFRQLLGEVRIVYAMTMVTIPAGQSVHVEALAQKRQYNGRFKLFEENEQSAGRKEYRFDFMADDNSRLNIEKTVLRMELPDEWEITDENMKLKKQSSAYRAVLGEKTYYVSIKQSARK